MRTAKTEKQQTCISMTVYIQATRYYLALTDWWFGSSIPYSSSKGYWPTYWCGWWFVSPSTPSIGSKTHRIVIDFSSTSQEGCFKYGRFCSLNVLWYLHIVGTEKHLDWVEIPKIKEPKILWTQLQIEQKYNLIQKRKKERKRMICQKQKQV